MPDKLGEYTVDKSVHCKSQFKFQWGGVQVMAR